MDDGSGHYKQLQAEQSRSYEDDTDVEKSMSLAWNKNSIGCEEKREIFTGRQQTTNKREFTEGRPHAPRVLYVAVKSPFWRSLGRMNLTTNREQTAVKMLTAISFRVPARPG